MTHRKTGFSWSWSLILLLIAVAAHVGCAAQERSTSKSATAPAAQTGTSISTAETSPQATPPPADESASNSPLQPEPTATATNALPVPTVPAPTITPKATSTEVDGWLTYENEFLGYRFSYPPEARIRTLGVTGFPTEERPEDMSDDEYFAYLQSIYRGDLCTDMRYKTGFVVVMLEDEAGGRYSGPCGITGVGDYTIESWEEAFIIDGRSYTASAARLYKWQTDQLEHEYYLLLHLDNNLRIDIGISMKGTPRSAQQDLSEAEINAIRETLRQVIASFRFTDALLSYPPIDNN